MKKVALIGCGAVSQLYYAPAFHELEKHKNIKVDCILDPDPDNRLKLLEHFPDAEMILEIPQAAVRKIDLAVVASPPDQHAVQCINLLELGIPVLCEKPIATSSAQAKDMIRTADKYKIILAAGLVRRFFPAVQTIKHILSVNLLGEIKSFNCYEGNIFRWPIKSHDYFHKNKGGVLIDIGVHVLDLILWLMGEPESIYYEDDAAGGIEVNCRIRLSFPGKFEGEIRLSRDTNLPNRYIIRGDKGWLIWEVNESDKLKLGFYKHDYHLAASLYNETALTPANNFQQSFLSQLLNVISAIDDKSGLFVPAEQAVRSIELIEYCYKHRNLLTMPWLSEQETIAAKTLHNYNYL